MKRIVILSCVLLSSFLPVSHANVVISQPPVSGGGVTRNSQLWLDPIGDNDSNGDTKAWTDFQLGTPQQLDHIEWWGNGASDQGFRIEFWRQDPGTIAYQPLAVFDGQAGINPEARFTIPMGDIATTIDNGGLTHYAVDLPGLVSLGANDSSNPRWFVGVIALTNQFSGRWNWAQGIGPGQGTFYWVRGDTSGSQFHAVGDNRAMLIGAVPEPSAVLCGALLSVGLLRRSAGRWRNERSERNQ